MCVASEDLEPSGRIWAVFGVTGLGLRAYGLGSSMGM